MDIDFEQLEKKHGPEVMAIFNYCVENGFAAYPEQKLSEEFFGRAG